MDNDTQGLGNQVCDLPPETFNGINIADPSSNPKVMLDKLLVHDAPSLYLNEVPPSERPRYQLPDWHRFYTEDFYDLQFNLSPGDFELEFYTNYLLTQYEIHAGHSYIGDESDIDEESIYDELWEFLKNPSETIAQNNSILSIIPNIVEVTKASEEIRKRTLAEMIRDRQGPMLLLKSEITCPPEIGDGTLHCFIHLSADEKGGSWEELQGMQLWEYSATFVHESAAGNKPVAVMTGHYIPLFRDGLFIHPSDFFYWMDAHSAMLNDVWKVITYTFLPQLGYESLVEFCDTYDDAATIVTVEIEIAPSLRGKRVSAELLRLFADTFEVYPDTVICDGCTDAYDCDLGIPGIFVFPVPGTPPGGNERLVLPLLAQSPAKVRRTSIDPEIEARKQKLTSYFNSLADEIDQNVVVYDPWDYPMT